MKLWIPKPWQPGMLSHMLDVPRCALWADMGMGKTSTMLMVLMGLLMAGEIRKTLIIGPLLVAQDVWLEEVRRWAQLSDLKVQLILGPVADRLHALQNDKADIYVVNYDNLEWLVDRLYDHWPFDVIVADEARRLKNARSVQGGARTEALSKVAFLPRVRRFIELTGRPAPNGLTDLWGQLWYLDHGERLGTNYTAFENRWFGFQRIKDAVNPQKFYTKRVVFPHSQAEIQGLIADLCLTVDPKDWFDVKEPVSRRVTVQLPEKAKRPYREMHRNFFTQLEGHDIEAFAAAAKSQKLMQLSSGFAYVENTNEREWVLTHDAKIEALRSIMNEAEGPVLVAYEFIATHERLRKAFKDGADLSTKEGRARFKAGEAAIGFGHPKSMGHGVDGLQEHCATAVFLEPSWNLDERDQFIGRIGPVRQKQSGKDRVVTVYDIVADGTIDEVILDRIESKRSVQDVLLEAMKRERKAT